MPIKYLEDYPRRDESTAAVLVSVITTVRNGDRGLQRAIDSVAEQNIPELEYIIADGGSTDRTLDIIRSNPKKISYWKSEPDMGISDGINKGIALANGKYIALMHADDWLSPDQISQGVNTLETTGADFAFGDLLYYKDGNVSHRIKGDEQYRRRLPHVMPALNHPTVIVRRSTYEKAGLFDTDYKYAMDYEFFLRLERLGMRGAYNPNLVGNMSLDGVSDRYTHHALADVRRASIVYGYPKVTAWLLFFYRIAKSDLRRFLQKVLPESRYQALRTRANPDFFPP